MQNETATKNPTRRIYLNVPSEVWQKICEKRGGYMNQNALVLEILKRGLRDE